ncbi:MAG: hypothetical protein ACON4I_02155 [Candidatus Puniceispirillaceae bacterium]
MQNSNRISMNALRFPMIFWAIFCCWFPSISASDELQNYDDDHICSKTRLYHQYDKDPDFADFAIEAERRMLACTQSAWLNYFGDENCWQHPSSEDCFDYKIFLATQKPGFSTKVKLVDVVAPQKSAEECSQLSMAEMSGCFLTMTFNNGLKLERYVGQISDERSIFSDQPIVPAFQIGDLFQISKTKLPPDECSSTAAVKFGLAEWQILHMVSGAKDLSILSFQTSNRRCGGDSARNFGNNWWK